MKQLLATIEEYVEHHNNHARGYRWTAQADDILEKVCRARATLDKITSD